MAKASLQRVSLVLGSSLFGADGKLATEFRLFQAGLNETAKGEYLFDEQASRDVMADYGEHGLDLVMIDLEHLSLDSESRNFDPDARGWCKLELRNGELWATQVTWTPDGAARLTERRQQYPSPTFDFDPETKRVASIHNIALTAMPATHGAQQLIAASKRRVSMAADGQGGSVDPSVVGALGLGEGASLIDVVTAITKLKTALNGDEPDGDEPMDDDGEDLDDAEMTAAGAAPAPPPPAKDAAPDAKKAAMTARRTGRIAARKTVRLARLTAHRDLLKKTGEKTTIAALSVVETWRSAFVSIEKDREKLATERKSLELAERKEHVTNWVKLGKEDPATAFDPVSKELIDPWASMPIEKIRARSVTLNAGVPAPTNAKPPTKTNDNGGPAALPTVLDAKTIESLKRQGIDPELAKLKLSDPDKYREALRASRGRHTREQLDRLSRS